MSLAESAFQNLQTGSFVLPPSPLPEGATPHAEPEWAVSACPTVPASSPFLLGISDQSSSNPVCIPPVEVFARVLHIINGEHFSGAERVQQLLGNRLGDFGVHAEFACLKAGKFLELCGLESDRVCCTPMASRLDLRVVSQLILKVKSERFDLLHAHTPRSAIVAAMVSARTGLPWCYHVHSPTARDSTRGLLNRVNLWTERLSIQSCTKLITVSESLYCEMLRLGVSPSRLEVVPNGVPSIEPIDADSRLLRQKWRLGMIALMRPRKGVEVALEAMHRLRTENVPVELELIGGFETESYQRQILHRIEELNLQSSVHWSGFTTDIPSSLHRLDGLLLPSLFGEGMPMVVLEALAAGLPVVGTRVEGTPEVVRDGVEGLIAEPRSNDSLADKIRDLVSDRQRWKLMSRAALARHRTLYTDLAMAGRIAAIYRKIVPSRGANPV